MMVAPAAGAVNSLRSLSLEAANLMFSLVSNRYERGSMIVTSNKPFSKAHRFE
jgi:hypothetical protein